MTPEAPGPTPDNSATPGEFAATNPTLPTYEEMQDQIVKHGWDNNGYEFIRQYPRVNELLVNGYWRGITTDTIREISRYTKVGGFGLGVTSDDLYATIKIGGKTANPTETAYAYITDNYLRRHGFEKVDEAHLEDWHIIKKHQETSPPTNSRAFFEQSDRAAQIRRVALETIRAYGNVVMGEGMYGESMSDLVSLNQQLVALGIELDMHSGVRRSVFVDPVKRAEVMASGLRTVLMEGTGFGGGGEALIGEFNELGEAQNVAMVRSDSPAVKNVLFFNKLMSLAKAFGIDDEL